VRRRLLTSTLTIILATVALLGIPLGFVVDRVVHDDAQTRLVRDALRIEREFNESGVANARATTVAAELRRVDPPDDTIVVRYPSGLTVSTGARPAHAMIARVDGPQGTTVTLASSVGDVDARVARALFAIVALAIIALGGALALSLWQSSRLTAPLGRLARSATRLGEGDFSLATPRSGVAEIDAIADALDRSAGRVERLLKAERDFSAHASHQLRSALTGLQLRIEELSFNKDPDVRAEAEAALDQSTRLDGVIDDLLALARTGRTGIITRFDLAELARQHAGDIRPLFERENRAIVVDAPKPVMIFAAIGAFGQVLDILLSNALRHGKGLVTLRVYDDAERTRLEVEDAGTGIAPNKVDALFSANGNGAHGIGLALARTLVVAEGGTIALARTRPPVFRVELPHGLTQS
jgi:signal transduction histidine kinase